LATTGQHLHVVARAAPPRRARDLGADGELGDLVLTATIFTMSFLPIAGAVSHLGHWGGGTLGLAAAGSLLAGRELWTSARATLRARRRP
jgi:hypothetical protein